MENTAKQVVFIFVLLGMFFTVVMTMPSGFYTVSPDYDESNFPTYWDVGDIQKVKFQDDKNATAHPWDPTYFEIVRTGIDTLYIRLWWRATVSGGEEWFHFQHWNWGFWGWGTGSLQPTFLYNSDVLDVVDDDGNISKILMTCDHHNYIIYFANQNYTDLEESLDNGEVAVSIGVDMDTTGTVYSGWDLVGRLLTLQLPSVTPEISFIIGLPIFALVGFLAFIIITMVVEMLPLT